MGLFFRVIGAPSESGDAFGVVGERTGEEEVVVGEDVPRLRACAESNAEEAGGLIPLRRGEMGLGVPRESDGRRTGVGDLRPLAAPRDDGVGNDERGTAARGRGDACGTSLSSPPFQPRLKDGDADGSGGGAMSAMPCSTLTPLTSSSS